VNQESITKIKCSGVINDSALNPLLSNPKSRTDVKAPEFGKALDEKCR
jgi:hypothetical protein